MTSFVFPGQGSQYIGMAKDFYDNFNEAKLAFQEIEDHTKMSIKKIIFENPDDKLNITQYTQICIFAASYVIFKTYISEKHENYDGNVMLGHSLGEYTALACSKKIRIEDCCLILKKRGELMNNAVLPNITGMAALIGKNSNFVEKIIKDNQMNLEIANDNSPMQIVISGSNDELKKCKNIFLENGVKKFVFLNVSAAFHSKYMLKAQDALSEEIEKLNFLENSIKIISNYDADIHYENYKIKKNLKQQMANKVNWTKSIKKLEEINETNIIEIGPNKILSGLINRISKNFDIKSINKISDLN